MKTTKHDQNIYEKLFVDALGFPHGTGEAVTVDPETQIVEPVNLWMTKKRRRIQGTMRHTFPPVGTWILRDPEKGLRLVGG